MNPATAKTELPPPTQLRKAVFGGFLTKEKMNSTMTRARTSLLIVSIISVSTAFLATIATGQEEIHAFMTDAGDQPHGRLVQATDGNFYGTTEWGGTNGGFGTVFKMTPAGQLTVLIHFSGSNGRWPEGGLIQASDGNFYGTTHS